MTLRVTLDIKIHSKIMIITIQSWEIPSFLLTESMMIIKSLNFNYSIYNSEGIWAILNSFKLMELK